MSNPFRRKLAHGAVLTEAERTLLLGATQRASDLLQLRGKRLTIPDLARLQAFAGFTPNYLHLSMHVAIEVCVRTRPSPYRRVAWDVAPDEG